MCFCNPNILIPINVRWIQICFLLTFRFGPSSLLQNISYVHICTMFKFRAVAIRIGSLQVDVLSLVVDGAMSWMIAHCC